MSYTPVELRHVRVSRSLFGYNRAMVEQVIEEVADSFENAWRERGELADQVHALEKQIGELKGREELLTHTLVAAEQAASAVREHAKREAELILAEAHHEARSIVRAAQGQRERLFAETRRIEALLRAALGIVEEGVASPARNRRSSRGPVARETHRPVAESRPAGARTRASSLRSSCRPSKRLVSPRRMSAGTPRYAASWAESLATSTGATRQTSRVDWRD